MFASISAKCAQATLLNSRWHDIRLAINPRQHGVRFRIVRERFPGADELQRAAKAIGNVGEMAERCREMAFVDVAMHVFVFLRANRLQEIRPVIVPCALGFLGLRERPLFPFVKGFPGVTTDFEPALSAVKKVADLLARAAFVVGVATARFQLNNLAVRVRVGGGLSVWRLLRRPVVAVGLDATVNHRAGSLSLVLREAENSPGRIHGNRVLVFIHAPARDIELMRARIAGVAVAGVPIPVPVVVTAFFVVGAQRCGAEPAVVVKRGGRRAILGHAIGIACLKDKRTRHVELADAAAVKKGDRLAHIGGRAVV